MTNEFQLNLLSELIASLVGVFTGFFLAMLIEKNKRVKDEQNRKEDMIKSMIAEVTDNKILLDRGRAKFSAINVNYIDSIFSTDAFDSAVFSSSYQLLTIETQRYVTRFFKDCKQMNQLLEQQEFYKDAHVDKGVTRYISAEITARTQKARDISQKIFWLYSRLSKATGDLLSRLEEELGYTWAYQVEKR